jgi:hypothetical protein
MAEYTATLPPSIRISQLMKKMRVLSPRRSSRRQTISRRNSGPRCWRSKRAAWSRGKLRRRPPLPYIMAYRR